MCMMSFFPPEIPADRESLYNGGMNNPDGHGWAIVDDDRILVGKSMNLTEALDGFMEARAQHLEGPALFHSRYATHGTVDVSNVHPFEVSLPDQHGVWRNSPSIVMAHNGILRGSAQPAKGDKRSDTRKFAEDMAMKQFRRLDKPGVRNALTQWCTTANKLVFLTVDRRFDEQAYIINPQKGVWQKSTNIWYSNYDYLYYVAKGHRWGGMDDYEEWPTQIGKKGMTGRRAATGGDLGLDARVRDDEEQCRLCWSGSVNTYGYCDFCKGCADCTAHIRECQCFYGAAQELCDVEEFEADIAAATRLLAQE